MKKVFYCISALLAIGMAACTSFEKPVSEDYGVGPEIQAKVSASDSSATFILTIDTLNTNYFSCAIAMSGGATPDKETLLKGGNLHNIKDLKEGSNTFSLTASLIPNMEYDFFAVAASKMGVIGEVVTVTFKTTDNTSPELVAVAKDGSVKLQFSENVERGEGAIKMEYLQPYGDLSQTIEISSFHVDVLGPLVEIYSDEAPAGAIVLVSLEAGAFVDMAGHNSNAVQSALDMKTGKISGLYYMVENAPFDPADCAEIENFGEAFTAWDEFIGTIKFDKDIYPYEGDDASEEGFGKVIYSSPSSVSYIKVSTYIVSDSSVTFVLPKSPDYGDVVGFIMNGNFICDVFGNPNEEFEEMYAWQYSYGLDASDVTGKWDLTYFSGAYEDLNTETILITPDYATENGVVISNLFAAGTTIEGTFDGDKGILSIPDYQLLTTISGSNIYFVSADGSEEVEFQYDPSSNSLSSVSSEYPFGYYVESADGSEGWLDYSVANAVLSFSENQDYGLSRDILIGYYNWMYYSYVDEVNYMLPLSIEADPEEENGLIIKNLFIDGSEIYASFNTATGQLVIPDWQALGMYGPYLAMNSTYDLDDITFDISADGNGKADSNASEVGSLWGVYAVDPASGGELGWLELSMGDILLNKIPENAKAPMRNGVARDYTLHKSEKTHSPKTIQFIDGPKR